MVVARIRSRYAVGFLGFLIAVLVAGVMAQPAEAQMQDSADLSVQKFDFPPTQVNVGEPLFYELNVANSTDSDTANNAVVVDDLPSNTEFLFTISGDCSNTGNTVTCDLGDLAPGELAVVEFAVCPVAEGTATNIATASSDTSDPDNSNNTATETTEVVGPDVGGCTTQDPMPPMPPVTGPMPQPSLEEPQLEFPIEEPEMGLLPEEPVGLDSVMSSSVTGDGNVVQQQSAGIIQDCSTTVNNQNGELGGDISVEGAECRSVVDQAQGEQDVLIQ